MCFFFCQFRISPHIIQKIKTILFWVENYMGRSFFFFLSSWIIFFWTGIIFGRTKTTQKHCDTQNANKALSLSQQEIRGTLTFFQLLSHALFIRWVYIRWQAVTLSTAAILLPSPSLVFYNKCSQSALHFTPSAHKLWASWSHNSLRPTLTAASTTSQILPPSPKRLHTCLTLTSPEKIIQTITWLLTSPGATLRLTLYGYASLQPNTYNITVWFILQLKMCSIPFNVRNTLHNGIMSALWWSGDLSGLDPPLLIHPTVDKLWWGINARRAHRVLHSLLTLSAKKVPQVKFGLVFMLFFDILHFASHPHGKVVHL